MSNYNRTKRKTEEDYHALAQSRGFAWIGDSFPTNVLSKTTWQCSDGHIWTASYNAIQQGSGCPSYTIKARKAEEDYISLAQSKGFAWVGTDLPFNADTKTFWKCQEDHVWQTPYTTIQQGKGCPQCAGLVRKKTEEDYYDLAFQRGFEWVADSLPINTETKTLWKCPNDHEWLAAFSSIRQGNSCPRCDHRVNGIRVSKIQIELHGLIQEYDPDLEWVLNYPVDRLRIDIACPIYKIGVEYDCWYWHKDKSDHDQDRLQRLFDQGWRILSIKTNRITPDLDEILDAINELYLGTKWIELVTEDWGK